MKLYVWEEFCPDYTDGLAFAIANDIEGAKSMLREKVSCDDSDWGQVKEYSLDKPICFGIHGGA